MRADIAVRRLDDALPGAQRRLAAVCTPRRRIRGRRVSVLRPRSTPRDHRRLQPAAGQSFILSYATLTAATDNTDDVITYTSVTKVV